MFFQHRTWRTFWRTHKHLFWPTLPGWYNYREKNRPRQKGSFICKIKISAVKTIDKRHCYELFIYLWDRKNTDRSAIADQVFWVFLCIGIAFASLNADETTKWLMHLLMFKKTNSSKISVLPLFNFVWMLLFCVDFFGCDYLISFKCDCFF